MTRKRLFITLALTVSTAIASTAGIASASSVQSQPELFVSTGSDVAASAKPLRDASLSGEVVIFVRESAGAETVSYFIDDPEFKAAAHIDSAKPSDRLGNSAIRFDISKLGEGHHEIDAVKQEKDGTLRVSHAAFTVVK